MKIQLVGRDHVNAFLDFDTTNLLCLLTGPKNNHNLTMIMYVQQLTSSRPLAHSLGGTGSARSQGIADAMYFHGSESS
jgi:hypothetical protein